MLMVLNHQTGYRPRVLIFSTSERSSMADTPLTALNDHTFGVRAVAFSPNSRYLASLGESNDGFLYIWAISGKNGTATLHACNKCTSTIQQVTWMGDSRFITYVLAPEHSCEFCRSNCGNTFILSLTFSIAWGSGM